MLSDWVQLGLDPDYFWRITLREAFIILKAAVKAEEQRAYERHLLAWAIGSHNLVAFNKPSKYPKQPRPPGERQRVQSEKEQIAMVEILAAQTGAERIVRE